MSDTTQIGRAANIREEPKMNTYRDVQKAIKWAAAKAAWKRVAPAQTTFMLATCVHTLQSAVREYVR